VGGSAFRRRREAESRGHLHQVCEREKPGLKVARRDAVRVLLLRALGQAENTTIASAQNHG
jgi:hypothetical protein